MTFIKAHTEDVHLLLVEDNGGQLSYMTHDDHRGSQEEEAMA